MTEHNQLWREVGGAWMKCSHAKVQAWDVVERIRACTDCSGTGKLYAFPALREECHHCQGMGHYTTPYNDSWPDEHCGGTGVLIKQDVELLLDALPSLGFTYSIFGPGALLDDETGQYNGLAMLVVVSRLDEDGHENVLTGWEGSNILEATRQALRDTQEWLLGG